MVNHEARSHVRHARTTDTSSPVLAIIISACLIADPTNCKGYKIPLISDIDPRMCLTDAPSHFGKWANEYPGWRITRWRCGSVTSQEI